MPKVLAWAEVVRAACEHRLHRLDARALEAAILAREAAERGVEAPAQGEAANEAGEAPEAAQKPAQRRRRGKGE